MTDSRAHDLGPFTARGQAELAKDAIELALPLRRCTHAIGRRTRFSPCALPDLGRCPRPRDRLEALSRALDDARRTATLARRAG